MRVEQDSRRLRNGQSGVIRLENQIEKIISLKIDLAAIGKHPLKDILRKQAEF